MAGIYKAYDIRGTVPEQIDPALARDIGRAFGTMIGRGPIVVGRDMRASGVSLGRALREGLTETGCDVIDIGLASTPMLYFAVGHLDGSAGVQITASHNPAEYNGFKLTREEAIPIAYQTGGREVEQRVKRGDFRRARRAGRVTRRQVFGAYKKHVLGFLEPGAGDRRRHFVLDAGNGMGGLYQSIIDALGARADCLYMELDGSFPHHEANPLKPENLRDLQRRVRATRADFGIAFDGDADRCIAVDGRGRAVGCDFLTALLARGALARQPGAGVVYDLRSSWVVAEEVRALGGRPIRERVGHSYIKATMRRHRCIFGGELSGHFYYRENSYCDSGLITLVQILNLLHREGQPLGALIAPLHRYHSSGEQNFEIADKRAMLRRLAATFADGKVDHKDGVTVRYPDWWFNVRPSNTEPLLRLNLEGRTSAEYEAGMRRVLALLGPPPVENTTAVGSPRRGRRAGARHQVLC